MWRYVQFHPSNCPEAAGTPRAEWDTSHDVSVIIEGGQRLRIASFRTAAHAQDYCDVMNRLAERREPNV